MQSKTFSPFLAIAVLLFSRASGLAASPDDFCAIIKKGREDIALVSQQLAAEKNPLKRTPIAQREQASWAALNAAATNFVRNTSMENWHGTVVDMDNANSTGERGFTMSVKLDCTEDKFPPLTFLFVDILEPQWAKFDPKRHSPLAQWRSVLENLSVGDRISWNGRFEGKETLELAPRVFTSFIPCVVTNLAKGNELPILAEKTSATSPADSQVAPNNNESNGSTESGQSKSANVAAGEWYGILYWKDGTISKQEIVFNPDLTEANNRASDRSATSTWDKYRVRRIGNELSWEMPRPQRRMIHVRFIPGPTGQTARVSCVIGDPKGYVASATGDFGRTNVSLP